jgi:hypothetical protein
MKKKQKQLATKNVIFAFLLSMTCLFSLAQVKKNEISISTGVSVPVFSYDNASGNAGSQGSNFSLNYGRVISQSEKRFFTLNAKYLSVSNPYSLTDSDVQELNLNSQLTSVSGTWVGSADKFKLSSYLIGLGYHSFLGKNKKLISNIKINIGSATFTSPALNYQSVKGFKINISEVGSSSFIYTSNAGLSYEIFKNTFLGLNLEYAKSSFDFDNQELSYYGANGAGANQVNPYKINFATLNANAELIFRF